MTLNDLKKEKIAAMKRRDTDAVNALNVVINKLMLLTIEKREKGDALDEADVLTVLKKTEKELLEERLAFEKAGRTETVASLDKQLETVRKYLPQMMSAEEIKEIILSLENKSLPSVMKHFKAEYAGKVDMKTVSEVLKSL
ncbi:MAG: GatB/YqeY domain-containing protein [Clostridia bacterium]|nr:GatB/YqeY domain-containing protein [Clostridia bacterium]